MPGVQIDTELTTQYLSEMVAIDSINPSLVKGGAGESELAAWLMGTCESLGMKVLMQSAGRGRPNVVAHWRGKGDGRSLLLTGHMDVVGIENMTIEPFQPEIRDGRLYGRGAYDMKGGLAAILGAAHALHEAKWKPQGDVFFAFVADEEYASIGTAELVKKLNVDAAILAEPTEMQVCTAHRGFAWLTITTHGRAAHGSLFDEGVDAVAHMGRVLGALEKMDAETLSKRAHPLLQRPSVHASLIDGGLGLSTYPDACRLQIEHRLLPDESGENVLALWQGALSRLSQADPAFSADVSLDFERPGYEIADDAPIVEMVDSVYQDVTGRTPQHVGQMAWLDASLLGEAGIPTVILGPSGAGAHAAVEYVDLASVHECASVLAKAAARWTSQPVG